MESPQPGPAPGSGLPPGVEPGDIGKRVIAYLIEWAAPGVIVWALSLIGALAQNVAVSLIIGVVSFVAVIGWVVFVWWSYVTKAAGPGKQLMGLQVVGFSDGRPLSWGRVIVRWLLTGAIAATGIGAILLLVFAMQNPRRQSWADQVADSVVIKERALAPKQSADQQQAVQQSGMPSQQSFAAGPAGPAADRGLFGSPEHGVQTPVHYGQTDRYGQAQQSPYPPQGQYGQDSQGQYGRQDQYGSGQYGQEQHAARDQYGQGPAHQDEYSPGLYRPDNYGSDQQPGRYGQDPYGQGDQGQGDQGRYGQDQYQDQYQQGQYGQDPYAQDQYQQGQYGQDQYGQGQGQYGQGQYSQDQYGQGQYGGQGYQGQYDMNQYGTGSRPAGTGLGIASLVLGIVALLTCWFVLGIVPGIVGLVLGIVALRKLGRTPGASKALPIIGIVLSVLAILASILFLVLFGALIGEFGPAMEACSQYSTDQAALQECIEREMGLTTGQGL